MKKYLFTALVIGFTQFASAQQATATEAKEILMLTNVNAQYDAILQQVYAMIPEAKLPEFKKEVQVLLDKNTDKTAGIWAKYYTKAELADLKKFYTSPIGKKMIENTAKITKDAMADQQAFGMEMQQIVMKYMQ